MAHEHSKYWFNMTYTKEQKYEHDGGRCQGTMMNCFGTFNLFWPFPCQHVWLTEWAAGGDEVCKCVCPCVLFMCKCMMYLMSDSWLRFCLYCHTVNVYMSGWFVYSLSKDQFPLCVCITAAEYFQAWNCLSEHFRELLNVLFTQH